MSLNMQKKPENSVPSRLGRHRLPRKPVYGLPRLPVSPIPGFPAVKVVVPLSVQDHRAHRTSINTPET